MREPSTQFRNSEDERHFIGAPETFADPRTAAEYDAWALREDLESLLRRDPAKVVAIHQWLSAELDERALQEAAE